MVIPRGQHEFNRVPQSIHNGMQFCIRPAPGSPDCLIRRFSPSIGTFVNLDASRVQTQVFLVRICRQCAKHSFQCAIVLPLGKSGVHRLPWPIHLRQFSPLCSVAGNPKHPIEHFSIIFPRMTPMPCPSWWKYRFHAFPLSFCQFIPFHIPIFALIYVLCNIYFSNKP